MPSNFLMPVIFAFTRFYYAVIYGSYTGKTWFVVVMKRDIYSILWPKKRFKKSKNFLKKGVDN